MTELRSIPTRYKGYSFRSRLEARWAVYFDAAGIRFDYEPEGFRLSTGDCYLPDFWLPQVRMWAEVKPNDDDGKLILTDDARRKGAQLGIESNHPLVFCDGMPRDVNYWAIWPDEMDPVGWDWNDVYFLHARPYHVTDRRFFADTGSAYYPDHCAEGALSGSSVLHPAVVAARSARFDRHPA